MASIKKINTRKFKITVSNGYRPDGRKISRAKTIIVPDTVHGRSIPQYVSHEAEEFERIIKSGYCEDSEMTFQEYASRWLKRQTKYAPSTLGFYRRSLEIVYPYIGNIKLNRLRPIALENLLLELRKRTFRGKTIQETTVPKYLTVVSAVLSDAKKNEIIQKNPARMIDLPDTTSKIQAIPSDEEAAEFLNIIADIEDPYKTFYALAIYTGCRRGELCALKWSDFLVNGYEGILTVSRSRSAVPGKGIMEGPPKNGKSRTIYAPMTPSTFTWRFKLILKKNGLLEKLNVHSLRHSNASLLIANGTDVATVAGLLGHSQPSTTLDIYTHAFDKNKKAASEALQQGLEI